MRLRYVLYASIPLLLVILGIVYPISGFDDLPSSLVAWGTLMLAIATFTLIQHSKEQEKDRRNDELSKERRDREERLLGEIIEWAIDMHNCSFGHPITIDPRLAEDKQALLAIGNKRLRYQALDARSKYIAEIANVFEKELPNAVLSVTSYLKTVKANLIERFNNFEDAAINKTLTDNEKLLQGSVLELIKLVGNIKSGYVKTKKLKADID